MLPGPATMASPEARDPVALVAAARPVARAVGIVSVAPPYLYVAREYRPSLVLDLATGRLLGSANTLKGHPLSDPDAW